MNVVAGDVPGPHRAIEYQLRDAGGRVLRHAYGPDGTRLRFVRTLARIHGLPAVTLSTVEGAAAGADLNGQTCLAFGRPPADDDSDCWSVGPDVAAIEADCSTRRIVITTVLAHRGDTLSVRLADGREVRGHVIPLPADLRRFAAAAAVVVLGPHDAPRTLIRRGWSPLRVARVLPPGARQCGYETYALLTSG
ncbi:MAG TPA: hypothetical protein VI318_23445 [Baekduia sp.]